MTAEKVDCLREELDEKVKNINAAMELKKKIEELMERKKDLEEQELAIVSSLESCGYIKKRPGTAVPTT